jgi:uncharacterized protein
MKEREDIVTSVLAAAGGELIGRVRLQKTVYLLDRLGFDSGLPFDYHHFGPYSRDLDNATADAKAFGLIEEEFDRRQSDGATYSIFRLKGTPKEGSYGKLGIERTGEFARLLAETNVTVLELAATIDWLCRVEKYSDWRSEITKRKGVKVKGGRLEKALGLLEQLSLSPSPA